uniref:TBC domain-containing protein kinase-like protein n=1 Tax=Caenorhabditis japonica TaxID=281687 RepID=A0A8R1DR45_CAEJA
MGIFPDFGAFVLRAEEKDGRTCINGMPVASPSKQMLGRFPKLQALRHPNLCAYLHFSETIIARDLVIIVMEYYSLSLFDRIRSRNVSDVEKIDFYGQILTAIDFLHRKNVTHGLLSLEMIRVAENGKKNTLKLFEYGLPFLTNGGKDAASSYNSHLFQAPEKIVQGGGALTTCTFQSDVWDLGIVLVQLYLNIVLEDAINENDYLAILNKNQRNSSDGVPNIVFEDIREELKSKNKLSKHIEHIWMEDLINNCLQLDCEARPSICQLFGIVKENTKTISSPLKEFKVKTVDEIRAKLHENLAENKDGFEKLSIENSFYLWKTCGSTPEMILLKKGFVQNHAPISSYPAIRYDDFLSTDSDGDSQSTFATGILQLPNKRTLSRVENDHTVSSALFHKLELFDYENRQNNNILYETSSNMLTVEHLLNASAVANLSEIIPRLAEIGILSTQRADVWSELLGITESKWRDYLNLDVLAPHSSDRQLEVDIPRCHQYDSFMTTPAVQESLRKVLKGWQIITEPDNYVYWQGCDSLATPFLLTNIDKPHLAYACFKEFTYRYCHKFYLKDNSEVIKEYLGIFYHLVAYLDPVLYKHLKINGFDAELFSIPWFLTCFAHELPLSKLVCLWDETMMHDSAFPLMIALAMLNRLRDKLLAVNFNEMIIIIHDQPDLSIDDVIKNAKAYERVVPPSCTFRAHASPWKAQFTSEVARLPNSMSGLPLLELSQLHFPRLSTEELIWRLERNIIYAIDTRQEPEFNVEHFIGSYNHPNNFEADIDWLRFLPGIVKSNYPKCIIYGKKDCSSAKKLAETYVMKGVPHICILHEPYESVPKKEEYVQKN